MQGPRDELQVAEDWMSDGRAVAVATVIETWGSAPRPVGSHLVIDQDGNFEGSVSGGCVEGEVISQAMDVIASGDSKMLEFGVADETAWRVGLSCGGRIRVHVERGRLMEPANLRTLNEARRARQACVLVTDLGGGRGRLVREGDAPAGELGAAIEKAFRSGKSGVVEIGNGKFFLNVHVPPPRIVVIGAVHISQALAAVAASAGYDLEIIDPRTAFATPERFAGVRLQAEWPQDALAKAPLDRYSALVAVTHDPKIDDFPIVEALKAGCFYVGALGSRKTHARRCERLLAQGVAQSALDSIDAPIGLDIAAASPGEIAVAIMGAIIAAFRRRELAVAEPAKGAA